MVADGVKGEGGRNYVGLLREKELELCRMLW
jgi:hypothetical protein